MKKVLAILLLFAWGSLHARGDTLNIAVYNSAPYGYQYKDGSMGGLMPELWEEIAGELNYRCRYYIEDMSGLLKGLQNGSYDVALGAISITPEREKIVDFSHAVNPSGTGIAVRASSLKGSFRTYWRPILISLLRLFIGITTLLLTAGVLIWLIERKNNQHFRSGWRGLIDGMWWSAVTMTTVGYGDKVPKSVLGRMMAMTWIFVGIVLIALFTANASSIFLNTEMETEISTVQDLYSVRVGSVAKSSGAEYLKLNHISFNCYSSVDEALQALVSEKIDAVVYNTPVLIYYRHNHYQNEVKLANRELLKNNMGIAFPTNSPIVEEVNLILLQKITQPDWQNVVYSYFGEEF